MRILMTLPLLAAGLAVSAPASAQSAIEGRVNKLEHEMRAVQRKVFPNGALAQVEPQITAPQTPLEAPGTPAGSPIANLEARVAALESQQMTLTGQIEQAQYKLRQMEEAMDAYRRTNDARLTTLEGGGAAASGDAEAGASPPPAPARGSGNGGGVLSLPGDGGGNAAPAPAAAANGVEKPAPSGDPAEDAYIYGYRLWSAKQYSAAAAQLKTVVDKYPKHRRASWAQNLIGRSYLDDGKPSLASIAFYDNYKKMPDGERAPDSLFYLANALIQLKKPKDACDVYSELSDVYADRISASMKADIQRGRATAKCS